MPAHSVMTRTVSAILIATALAVAATAGAQETGSLYQTPAQVLVDIVDAPPMPGVQ